VASLPILLTAFVAIKLVDAGPSIFRQQREGKDGRVFSMLKLRTMYLESDLLLQRHLATNPLALIEWNRFLRLANDPRVLPLVGKLLRMFSIDELPQLWNVIRGDMSVIGPRPLPIDTVGRLDPWYRTERNKVLPGLTGLWQVRGRSDLDLDSMVRLDALYVRRQSFCLDVVILAKTPAAIFRATGAY